MNTLSRRWTQGGLDLYVIAGAILLNLLYAAAYMPESHPYWLAFGVLPCVWIFDRRKRQNGGVARGELIAQIARAVALTTVITMSTHYVWRTQRIREDVKRHFPMLRDTRMGNE